jgi:small neutral amino acid transporter SnatA (MarC family)
MNDLTRVAIGLFAVMAAPGALTAFSGLASMLLAERARAVGIAALMALAMLALIAAVNEPVLDWLSVSGENFQTAAGIVMGPLAFRLLWTGEAWTPQSASPVWRAWSLLSGPVPAVLMLSYAARFGIGTSIGAAVIALAASAAILLASGWLSARLGVGRGVLGRFNGALIVVLAVELILDGVQSA